MAEEEEEEKVASTDILQPPLPLPSPPFLEVTCKSTGKVRRFACGSESKFAISLINKKLGSGTPLASYIEAVKEGEEPISFGPTSVLVDYGDGWNLQTVTEEVTGKENKVQYIYKQAPTVMRSDGFSPAGISSTWSKPPISCGYIAKILLALVLIFLLGSTFTLFLENLPKLILLFTSSM